MLSRVNTLLLGLGTLAGAGAVLALSARSAKAAGPTSYAPYRDGYGPHIPSYTPTDPTQGTPAWCSPPPPLPARYTGDMALLHPEFRGKIEEVLRRLEGRGFRPRVHTSWRSAAYQADLVRTWPPRSWTDFSYHNVVDECGHPKSLAVDIIDRRWAWGDKAASRVCGASRSHPPSSPTPPHTTPERRVLHI